MQPQRVLCVGSVMAIVIGTAGWSIPRADAASFPSVGAALERYAAIFRGVEVNSSFHRPHRASTWARWAASVPDAFRFTVKVPKTITHQAKLIDVGDHITRFAQEVTGLAGKLGILLVQLPPKLACDVIVAERFFSDLQQAINAPIACEPRHPTWFEDEPDAMLSQLRVSRVAADPALSPRAAVPGGWRELAYWRLHGSPAIYRSPYSEAEIANYARQIRAGLERSVDTWCIFDNTARSAATNNAMLLEDGIRRAVGEKI